MRIFIDSSSLFKRYVDEKGSFELEDILQSVTSVAVSPLCLIELHSILARRMRDNLLHKSEIDTILKHIRYDFHDFDVIEWSEDLEQQSLVITAQCNLRTLDSIVLAAGCVSGPDRFLTSDYRLYDAAQQLFHETDLI